MSLAGDSPIEPAARRGRFLPLLAATGLVAVALAGVAMWLFVAGAGTAPPAAVAVLIPPAPPPAADAAGPATPADPTAGLTETSPNGPLPVKTKDGRVAFKVYARPFDPQEKRPRIAIIVGNLGTSATETDTAIRSLPGEVSLSFMPYRKRLGEWIGLARAAGHEVLLDLPMEPPDVLHNDPGPNALRTALDAPTNVARLEWMMAQATGYVGMVAFMGGRFEGDRQDLQPILEDLGKRGLLYVDNRASPQSVGPAVAAELKLPFAVSNRQIDLDPSRGTIDRRLAELEDVARRNGEAVGIAQVSVAVLDGSPPGRRG